MKIKLHWKLTVIFCSAVMFCLFLGYLYLSSHLKGYVERNLENNLRHQILAGKDLMESRIHGRDVFTDADSLADKISRQQDLRVTIIDSNGALIGDSELDASGIRKAENHLDRPEVQEARSKGLGISKRYSYTLKKYMLYMAVPFGKEELSGGFLRYAVTVSSIEMLAGRLKQTIAGTLLLVFLLSLLFTFVISFIVSRPLAEMARIARAMAKGDFSQRPSVFSHDEIGDLAMALSYVSDEIKAKIERLKQEGVKLDAVLSSMFEGIMVVDDKGDILLINPSLRRLFFVDSAAEMKAPVEAIRNPQIQEMVDKILKEKQSLISKEIAVSQPNERTLKVNAVPIIRNSFLEGAVLVFHDISELRRLERVRQDFVANVSHELRTPISSIKGYAETLLDGAIDDKDNLREFISIIYQNSNRLANLIDDLLDLAKIESGKMNMVFVPVEIKPVLNRCLGVLEKQIKDKQLSVSLNIPELLPKVLADDKRLAQVFLNLLDNAVKYTPDGGAIKLNISLIDKFARVDILDTGIGIPEQDLCRIFERFYRVDKARSREVGGTGLGLSIVKHIVLSHGGQVWVKSAAGAGSAFSFTIPLA